MTLFTTVLLFAVLVKSVSLEKTRDVFLTIASSVQDRQNVATTPATKTVINEIEAVSTQNVVNNLENKHSLDERSKELTIKGAVNLTTSNCSAEVDFNLTLAIEEGIEFQAEFCSWNCYGSSSRETSKRTCFSRQPSCARCWCDGQCSIYGDCCGVNPTPFPSNDTKLADNNTQQSFHCFQTDQTMAVYILASCPRRKESSSLELGQHYLRASSNINEADNLDSLTFDSEEVASDCNSCLSVLNSIHLITSYTSGITYCNQHCFICNEGRPVEQSDLTWQTVRYCSAESYATQDGRTSVNSSHNMYSHVLGDNKSTEPSDMRTDCQVYFHRPEGANIRECDRPRRSNTVNTCSIDLGEIQCDLSPETLQKLYQLCKAYYSPVYEIDQVYQNIFCYLCQGQVTKCLSVRSSDDIFDSDFSLAMLIELSDGNIEKHQEAGSEALSYLVTDDRESKQDKLKCQHGYWRDEGKGTCIVAHCAPGRHITGNTSTSEASCQLEDAEAANDIYKLNLVWYLQDGHSFMYTAKTPEYSRSSNIATNSDMTYSNNQHTNQVKNQDVVVREEYFLSSLQPEFTVWCFGDSFGIRSGDVESDNIHTGESTFFTSEQSINDRSRLKDRGVLSVLQSSTVIHTESNIGHLHEAVPWKVMSSTSKKLVDVSKKNVAETMKYQIGLTLTKLNVTDFLFQIYNLQTNDATVQTVQSTKDAWEQEHLAETSKRFSQESMGMGALVYLKCTSGLNRSIFESNIVRHFVGEKNFLVGDNVITIEQSLFNSDSISLDSAKPVHHSDHLNAECCSFAESDKRPELMSQKICSHNADRLIMFNAVTSCPYVTFNISDFNVSTNFKLLRHDLNVSLPRSQYVREDQAVYVCIKTLDNFVHEERQNVLIRTSLLVRLESFLTVLSLSFSLACLIVTFITYLLFPLLRSLPGKNNMILVCWLFAAQLLLLLSPVPTKHSWACAFMGVLLHYAWLSTLSWTCVCSFHMYYVFFVRRGVQSSRKSHSYYLIRYALVSNSAPAVVVCSVVFTNMYLYSGDLGYGGGICYLNSVVLIGVAFVLPLSLVLLFNCLFLFLTIYSISRIEEVKRQSGRERRNIHIYFRLSSLTGLTWFLALLAEIPGLQSLRCASVLINGCQGITIFLSYVCNRRVKRMYGYLFRPKATRLKGTSGESNKQTFSSSL